MREGPALLTSGWVATHPSIPLSKLEELVSLEFLSSSVMNLSLDSSQEHQTAQDYTTESIVAVSGEKDAKTIIAEDLSRHLDSEMEVSSQSQEEERIKSDAIVESSTSTGVVVDSTDKGHEVTKDEGEEHVSTATALSTEEIVAMWNEHYNRYYWYMYQGFVGAGQSNEEQAEGEESESQESEAMEPMDGEVSNDRCT